MKIFLEKNRSVLSNNIENYIDVEIEAKNRLLPDESLVDNFSIYNQYIKERDECCNYRIILNVNPICSNVLFNSISEIVVNEGSDDCACLNFENLPKSDYAPNAINTFSDITYRQAIRDTEYSNPEYGKFVYHCGIDIFNNHMLRKKIFIHVNKLEENYNEDKKVVYNTIADYLRDNNGKIITENMGIRWTDGLDCGIVEKHLYDTNSLDTLKNAFYTRCKENEGWWGFINPGTINIPNSNNPNVTINEMLSNNKPCEFIDFYPDRTLYSFIPKYNKIRRRVENNWDYCLTYPADKDYDIINEICGGKNGEIKVRFKTVTNSNGVKLLQCSSLFKHSFKSGSYANFYYYSPKDGTFPDFVNSDNLTIPLVDDTTTLPEAEPIPEYEDEDLDFQLYQKEVRIYSVGDLNGKNVDRIFSVRYDDIKTIYAFFGAFGCFYKKVTNGCECKYYARIFKKLKNESGNNLISDVNKTAFSKNIYGDDIAQIIFTDNVDLCGKTDENGREISEIYFTAIKRNAGNEKWYINKEVGDESIEFSHCFGPLTSGIDFSGVDINEEPFDYNIHYLHNMDSGVCRDNIQAANTFSAWGETILNGMPKYIESGITIENDTFYGDIVEFDSYEYVTNKIADICHRFNTMQRESFDLKFRDMYQDVILHDDYEVANFNKIFTVDTYYCNDTLNSLHSVNDTSITNNYLMYCNINPEGYFYNPHSKIQIKRYGDVQRANAEYINYDEYELRGQNVVYVYRTIEGEDVLIGKRYVYDYFDPDYTEGISNGQGDMETYVDGVEGCILKIKVPTDLGFFAGDYIAAYDKITGEIYWGVIKSFKNRYLIIYFNDTCFDDMDILNHSAYFAPNNAERRFFIFWSQYSVPFYAKLSLNSKEFCWRPILNPSELDKNDDLSSLPFSNGCIYVQKNLNFFLKRQDPYGEYGLSYPLYKYSQQIIANPMIKYVVYGSEKIDLSYFDFVTNKELNTCY